MRGFEDADAVLRDLQNDPLYAMESYAADSTTSHRNITPIEDFFNFLFNSIDFPHFEVQNLTNAFINQLRGQDNLNKSVLRTELDFLLPCVPKEIITNLMDRCNASDMESLRIGLKRQVNLSPDDVCPGPRPYSSLKDEFDSALASVNVSMPFVIPSRDSTFQTKIYRISEVVSIDDNLIMIRAAANQTARSIFFVQRVPDSRVSANIFASMTIFRNILSFENVTRQRSVILSLGTSAEIGRNLIMTQGPSTITSLDDYFLGAVGVKSAKYRGPPVEGVESSMLKANQVRFNASEFVRQRSMTLKSHIAAGYTRLLFGRPYPSPNSILFAIRSMSVPLIYADLLDGFSDECAIRLSPNIANFVGTSMEGESMLTVCAMSQAFTNQVESFRSAVEMMPESVNLESILELRHRVESVMLKYSPPRGPGASCDDSIEWGQNIQTLINEAQRIDDKPAYANPWF